MGQQPSASSDDEDENFTALWLDAEVNTNAENRKTEEKLRKLLDPLKTFNTRVQCEKFIRSYSKGKLLLIVSGRLGRELVPHVHNLPQLVVIYVFCKDKKANEQWAVNFTKIKAVISRISDLISRLEADKESFLSANQKKAMAASSSANEEAIQSLDKSSSSFAFPYLLPNALLQTKVIETDKTDLISLLKDKYRDDESELNIIDEFRRTYTSEKAIWWYTRHCCIRYLLNIALQIQDINTLFLYQFFICDLHQQITECQIQSPIRVYHGITMSADQINGLKESVGTLMSFDRFLSTAPSYDIAVGYTKYCPANRQPVIFEVSADPKMTKTKPFGNIAKYSQHPQEQEVLFSINSIFHIIDVQRSSDGLWNVRMTLCSDTDPELQSLVDKIKKRYGSYEGETALVSFSQLLREMKKLNEAERYCHCLLLEFSTNDSSLAILYRELAEIASEKNEPDISYQWRMKAIEIEKKTKTGSSDPDELSDTRGKTDPKSTAAVLKPSTSVEDSSDGTFRFTDVVAEKHQILLPIEGYEKKPLVSLEEAIEPLIRFLPDIRRKAHTAKLRCKNPADGLTPDQSAAITLYTMEWEPRDQCLYFVLNARLRAADRNTLKPWFLFLKLMLTGLSRLPSVQRTVYRGVKLDLTPKHIEGDQFFWWGFSSCTTTMNVLKADEFLGNSGIRTFFLIDTVHGKDIRNHSYFEKEEEILLLPATYFEVKSVFELAPDLHAVQLREIIPEYPYLEPVDGK